MARDANKWVTLYSPGGTEVDVKESRAEVLKGRGYTTSKPRNPGGRTRRAKDDNSAELQAQLDAANAKIAELEQGQQFPPPADQT